MKVIQVLTAASGNFTVPADVYELKVSVFGRGGAGAAGAIALNGGGGGGAGGYAQGILAVTPGQVIPYAIPTSGTSPTFFLSSSALFANPGSAATGVVGDLGGSGGGTSASVSRVGGSGHNGENLGVGSAGGNGGSNPMGSGGRGGPPNSSTTFPGSSGGGFGGGGGGGNCTLLAGAAGGAGGVGRIIVEYETRINVALQLYAENVEAPGGPAVEYRAELWYVTSAGVMVPFSANGQGLTISTPPQIRIRRIKSSGQMEGEDFVAPTAMTAIAGTSNDQYKHVSPAGSPQRLYGGIAWARLDNRLVYSVASVAPPTARQLDIYALALHDLISYM